MMLLLGYALKSSVILLAALATVRILRGRSAAFRHALLSAAIVAAAAVPLLTLLLPARSIPLPVPAARPVPPVELEIALTQPDDQDYYEVAAFPRAHDALAEQAPEGNAQAAPAAAPVEPKLLFFWLWIGGVGILLTNLAAGMVQLMRISRRSTVLACGPWVRLAGETARRYGITSRITLLETCEKSVLATWGVFRPKLLLPADAASWPEERIRVVLHHELAHIRRYDWILHMAAEVLRAVYWFNPLCWIACEALVQESEQACDDLALGSGITGPEYARQLLALTVALEDAAPAASAALSMSRPSTLERRFVALLNPRENRTAVTRLSMVSTLGVVLAFAGPISSLRLEAGFSSMPLPRPGAPGVPGLEALQASFAALVQQVPPSRPPLPPPQAGPVGIEGPAPATMAAPAGTASIEGTVVKFGGSEPIAGATVSLQRLAGPVAGADIAAGRGAQNSGPQRPPPGPGVVGVPPQPLLFQSGEDGKFVFSNLPAGTYRLVALRAEGFVVAEHGQQTFNGRGRPVPLAEGQRLTNVTLAMMPTGSISGRILDRFGDPLGRAQVQALQATYREGRRILKIIQSVQTNDAGEYRLFWLPPGPYYLSARPEDPRRRNVPLYVNYPGTGGVFEQAAPPVLAHRVLESGAVAEESFVLVYYPGTTDLITASAVDLRPGDNVGGLSFSVGAGQVRSRRLRGRVADANGRPVTSGTVMAIPRTPHPNATIPSASLDAAGLFEIAGVAPGAYYIVAGNPLGIVAVDVGGSDIENITVISKPGVELSGRILIEGKRSLETDPDLVRLQANCPGQPGAAAGGPRCLPIRFNLVAEPALIGFPAEGQGPPGSAQADAALPNGVVLADGTFSFRNLSVRDYRLAFTGLPPGWFVRSARLGTIDPISNLVSFPSRPERELEVVIGIEGASVEGRVVNATGQSVPSATAVLIPEVSNRGRRDLYRTAVTDDSGVFRFQSVAPGEYKVFAWEEIEVSSWLDPEIVRPHENRGRTVRVSAGVQEIVEIVVIPAPR